MSKPYGPYNSTSSPAVTAGTVTGIPVNQDAVAVRVSNQSLTNDVLVSFAASTPPVVTQVGGNGPWSVVLHPGDRITCTLQNPDRTPTAMGQYWAGTVWLLPLSTASQLAQNGTVPSLSNVWITTYQAGEPIPPTDPGPLGTSQTGQQRVVNVPTAVPAAAGTWGASTVTPLALAIYPLSNYANIAAAGNVNAYLYAATVLLGMPPNGTVNVANLAIDAAITNNTGVVQSGLQATLASFSLSANATASGPQMQTVYAFAGPVAAQATFGFPPANAGIWQLRIRLTCSGMNGTPTVYYTVLASLDPTNPITFPAAIGAGGSPSFVASAGNPNVF